ncbi:anthrone oxygenase family protein [Streptosporangium sp. CA-135522]|uniref:anthrone oxygenase family protein n=1 Tax=Streptosporangium sp. CA-135522 TaxID=3240072 RepID=UPI003D943A56
MEGHGLRKRSVSGDLTVLVRPVKAFALLSTGLLAGAFGYGAVNVAYAFRVVPLDVRFTFHTALMQVNGLVMQTTMALAMLSSFVLAVMTRAVPRLLAAGAGALVLTSFLVTRFGNVPINGQIKQWAVTSAPTGYAAILQRWETFHIVRTVTAFTAFLLIVLVAVVGGRFKKPGVAPVTAE